MEISARELMATSAEYPLVVRFGPGMHVLRLQPGPEDGVDAMISNLDPEKNFGDHPYFEATFISEPILTVMRENRSLIRFTPMGLPKSARIQKVTLTLFYDIPLPWDSIQPVDTFVYNGFAWYGAVLQQVVEPWEEYGVTWGKQPMTIEANQVFITPFIKNANFIEVDVTRLFVPVQEIAAPTMGCFLNLRLHPSSPASVLHPAITRNRPCAPC